MSPTATIPRWEWRCFAPSLTVLAHAASIPSDAAPRESDETYILDLTGRISENVKIRDGVLDVKRFLQTDAEGTFAGCIPSLRRSEPTRKGLRASRLNMWIQNTCSQRCRRLGSMLVPIPMTFSV